MCPVCRARFRGARECSRCGADLTVVMTLAASAWRLRRAAREAVAAGDFARARQLASRAQEICYMPGGRRLEALSGWLGG
jgi:predicted amidophosphoribosyltransferase